MVPMVPMVPMVGSARLRVGLAWICRRITSGIPLRGVADARERERDSDLWCLLEVRVCVCV